MSTEGASAIHATAVALGNAALIIRGPSRSGKSTLAFALLARSEPQRPVCLVGDDRVLLRRAAGRLLVSPHPRIAGLIERRGYGILALPHRGDVPVAGIVDLQPATTCDLAGENFAHLVLVADDWSGRAARVLCWAATLPAQSEAKAEAGSFVRAKD